MSRDIDEGSVPGAVAGGGGELEGSEPVAGGGEVEAAADSHENDLVMPGFRFHPTEEELIEFYLRRKVEGRRFNVELITFLDLYRFDPWELPAMAVIGEKEWFFYVPRDRKYRNGDRPNRVTASGYWKATGADRMIRGENSRPIGLKKTLVFYSGKAPKGVRSSWIMNEYRLPPPTTDADLFYKSEISLCRVYKRSGIDDGGHGRASSSSNVQSTSSMPGPSRTSAPTGRQHGPSPTQQPTSFHLIGQAQCSTTVPPPAIVDVQATAHNALHPPPLPPGPSCAYDEHAPLIGNSSTPVDDELSRLVGHGQAYAIANHQDAGTHFFPMPPPPAPHPLGVLPMSPAAGSDKLWDWNPDTTSSKDYGGSSYK
ncbi:NAC domain-containing protein 22 isoform X2 [Brachypodium distachyon]|uniref:NAC domain-containing protein n=1 Tax=Brachypodium distachyon TaxID=15368 RepID=I1HJC4_BRADI|nr:NAC domain-containing protein 22 isoform X2 [Brachypodium distachyon]KQK06213.1 hypothetical protein BRADI_2g25150v3 [Brachypodium distachyon]|eukprot:XP_010231368.1 NAC domain-containing protein 22 isoform X2 [Brachypodium distachyon]